MRWSLVACVLTAFPLTITAPSWGQTVSEAPCPPGRICEPVPAGGLERRAEPPSVTPGADTTATPLEEASGADAPVGSAPGSRLAVPSPASRPNEPGSESAPPEPPLLSEHRRPAAAGAIDLHIPPPSPPGPPGRGRWRDRYGIATHLECALLGSGAADDSFMGGVGAAFRFRPLRGVALDTGFDVIGGRDWEGNRRREYVFGSSALLYFNPRDIVQVHLLTGLMLSRARVRTGAADRQQGDVANPEYWYLGGHLGLGLEWSLSENLALNLALTGFLRGRTDSAAADVPEFVHEDTGVGTNSSGGGILRSGLTYYF